MEAELETGFSAYVVDMDYSSMYPSVMRAINCSRMTMVFAAYKIEGKEDPEVQRYFTNLITARENSEILCSEFHGLPTYLEMSDIINKELKE